MARLDEGGQDNGSDSTMVEKIGRTPGSDIVLLTGRAGRCCSDQVP